MRQQLGVVTPTGQNYEFLTAFRVSFMKGGGAFGAFGGLDDDDDEEEEEEGELLRPMVVAKVKICGRERAWSAPH